MVGPRLLVPFIGVRILFRELFVCGWDAAIRISDYCEQWSSA